MNPGKFLACLLPFLTFSSAPASAELRLGIIGCDTSHCVAFTEFINNPTNKDELAGARVVAAFKGGSPDIPSSVSRIENYSKTLREKHGVTFYDTIDELCRNVDCVLLESVDGRPHLSQARPVITAHLPLFIDKPMAGSLRDALEIFALAREAKVPVFSSSALRFGKDTQAVRNGSLGTVRLAETYGPCELEPHHPDLFWYGVHAAESLFTVMGTGCTTVTRSTTPEGKLEVIGVWQNARKGILREDKDFHGSAEGEKGTAPIGSFGGYQPLVVEIVKFFKSGRSPVPENETIEIFAFMEAADASKRAGGAPVSIADVLKKSRQ
jgi:predicted dehydrogenase